MSGKNGYLGWLGIVRLGLVQTALGAIVVLTTSTLNRVMVVELAFPALLPGALVAIHYFVQVSRPRFGHGSDSGGRRTPWIIGGIALLGAGGILAAMATSLMSTSPAGGIALALAAFLMIGAGVGASGTCLLVLLAASVSQDRRAAAATITWIMMIAGFAVTAGVAGAFLDPFSYTRLVIITSIVSAIALITTVAALWGLETRTGGSRQATVDEPRPTRDDFVAALREVASEPRTMRFALFVFISMLAYSAQDLVLEPFAGAVFMLTPGESTQLGGIQHGGVLIGMLMVAAVGSLGRARKDHILRLCMMAGCIGSAALLALLALAGFVGQSWPLAATVFALGVANGTFAVAAIGSMMGLMSTGNRRRDGVRMGVWGAAQAVAFGLGGIAGTFAVDVTRFATGSAVHAYALVFVAQAALFVAATILAGRLTRKGARPLFAQRPADKAIPETG
jgi:BCD family chlorophyll transporter-like MFS transporter